MKRIKILEVVPSLVFGGVEQFLYNYLSHMNLDLFDVHILTQEPRQYDAEERFLKLGVKIHGVPTKRKNLVQYFKRTNHILKKEKFDIVHCHISTKSFWMLGLAKYNHVPIRIYHAHEAGVYRGLSLMKWKLFARLSLHYATDLFACGEKAARFCFGKKKYYFVPNAIDPKKFAFNKKWRKEIRNKYNISDEDFVIGSIARFVQVKNHRYLVDVLRRIKNEKFKLLFIGDGPLKEEIQKYCREMELAPRIIFLSSTNEPEKYYAAMDVVAMPSFSEGFPVIAVEAQCSGLPVVFSNNITREAGLSNDAIFVDLNDEKGWTNAITRAYKNRDIDDRKNGYVVVSDSKYNIYKSASNLEQKYLELFNGINKGEAGLERIGVSYG
ncbi:glycosyltransferase [Candidatus Saccharibacteria bacterium]|nr:glycosyltransferase [Candidatus Saccharibacteria bacterium]